MKKSLEIISHERFEGAILIVIILNTIALSMDKYPQFDSPILAGLSVLNIIFTTIFTAEVVLKITAFGIREFMKEAFNIFDLFIVITSLIQIVMKILEPEN